MVSLLVLFGAAIVVPTLVLIAVLSWRSVEAEQARMERDVSEVARSIATEFDRYVVAKQSLLAALATAPSLKTGDYQVWHGQARELADTSGLNFVLSDRDGRPLADTRVPWGAPLLATPLDIDRTIVETKRPGISNLIAAAPPETPLFAVAIPILSRGEVVALISALVPSERPMYLLRDGLPSAFWAASFSDRNGILVARTRDQAEWVGRPITDQLRRAAVGTSGSWQGPSHEGNLLLGGYARSVQSGWLVAVGVDRSLLLAPVNRMLTITAIIATALVALSTLLAVFFGWRITRPILALVDRAAVLGTGGTIAPLRSGVREVDSVSTALAEAATALDERDRALRESEQRLQIALDAAKLGTWDLDLRTDTAVRSLRHDQMFGYSELQPEWGRAIAAQHVVEEDRELFSGEIERALTTGVLAFEVRVRWPDGSIHWIAPLGLTSYDSQGRPVRMVGVVADITQRKLDEAQLRRSEERYRALVEAAARIVWTNSPDGRYLEPDRAWQAFTGQSIDEAREFGWTTAVHPDDRERTLAEWLSAVSEWRTFQAVYRLRRHDGVYRWMEVRAVPVLDATGAVLEWVGMNADVTERIVAEQALRESEKRLRMAQEAGRVGLWDWDITSDHATWTGRLYSLLGIDEAEFQAASQGFPGNVHPEDRARVEAEVAAALEGASTFAVRFRVGGNNGGFCWLEARGEVVGDATGRPLRMIGTHIDVTEQQTAADALTRTNIELERQVEERTREAREALAQLFEARKMDSLGRLSSGIAHDFNNLLMATLGSLAMLKKRLPDDAMMHRLLDNAVQGAERGATLTQRLLAFARRQELKPEPVEVARLVGGMQDLLVRSLGPSITIRTEFPDALPAALVDPNQLELAILNLAMNARDAMPSGGTITIGARPAAIAADAPQRTIPPGDYVCLWVRDEGTGMDETTLARASEPFFTTKGVGKGTGLGLSMVHGLCSQSGGLLRLHSRPGVGTSVEMWLRQAELPALAPAKGGREGGQGCSCGGPLTVLVVDDDAMVAMGTSAMLEDLGHQVVEANSGERALEVLRSGARVDVVLTDHAMPQMTGLELAKRIAETWPALPIVLATGYVELPTDGTGVARPRLMKPFNQRQLAEILAQVVGATADGDADRMPVAAR